MSKQDKCVCPLCRRNFTPEAGLTADEHLANGIIKAYGEMQQKSPKDASLPCPRCGGVKMKLASSKEADIQICDSCGIDEILRAKTGNPLPITQWRLVIEMFDSIQNKEDIGDA